MHSKSTAPSDLRQKLGRVLTRIVAEDLRRDIIRISQIIEFGTDSSLQYSTVQYSTVQYPTQTTNNSKVRLQDYEVFRFPNDHINYYLCHIQVTRVHTWVWVWLSYDFEQVESAHLNTPNTDTTRDRYVISTCSSDDDAIGHCFWLWWLCWLLLTRYR